MTASHEMIIGLGGTGGLALQAFKRVVQRRKAEAQALQEAAQIRYLYIDSNTDVQYGSKEEQFPAYEFILLDKNHLRLKELSHLRNIAPWLGNMAEHIAEMRGGSVQDAEKYLDSLYASGQLRRVGRLLFALHVQHIKERLRATINDMLHEQPANIRFRLFCSLGGGTGSGCLIDMITLIHSLLQEMNIGVEIYVYPFVSYNWGEFSNAGAFYENEYATLRDLNALMTGSFRPVEVGRDADTPQGNRFTAYGSPIKQVFLSSDLAPGTPRLHEQVKHMAEALFDTIVYPGRATEPACLKALTGEKLLYVNPGEPADGNPLRSYRFAALSLRRWGLPTQEAGALLKAIFETNMLKGWLNSQADRGKEKDSELMQELYAKENRALAEFLASEEKMRFAAPLPMHQPRLPSNTVLALVRALQECAQHHVPRLQQMGDDPELEAALEPIRARAAAQAEEDLLEHLRSLFHAPQDEREPHWGWNDIMSFLRDYQIWRAHKAEETERKLKESADRDKQLADILQARRDESAKMGLLTRVLTKKPVALYEAQRRDATARIDNAREALLLAKTKKLHAAVDAAIQYQIDKVREIISRTEEYVEQLERKMHEYENHIEHPKSHLFYAGKNDREYATAVRLVIAAMSRTAAPIAQEYRDLAEQMLLKSNAHDVAEMLSHISRVLVQKQCKEWHDTVCSRDNLTPVWDWNIMEYLERKAGPDSTLWEERIGRDADEYIAAVQAGIALDTHEPGLQQPQVSPLTAVIIGMPAPSHEKFAQWLAQRLEQSARRCLPVFSGRSDIYRLAAADDIHVLAVRYWFPARFYPVVARLHERYQAAAAAEKKAHALYFANIDDAGIPLESPERPSLMV